MASNQNITSNTSAPLSPPSSRRARSATTRVASHPPSSSPLRDLVVVLSGHDDSLLLAITDLLRTQVRGLTVVAAPDSELLKQDTSDVQVFLGDTSVESQAELCIERAMKEFGKVDLVISVSQEAIDESGKAWFIDSGDYLDGASDRDLRMSEFDHLLYSKIRSVYLLSRFLSLAGESRGQAGRFVLARQQVRIFNPAPEGQNTRAVLGATRAWMKSFAEESPQGTWLVFDTGRDLLEKLAPLATSTANFSAPKLDL